MPATSKSNTNFDWAALVPSLTKRLALSFPKLDDATRQDVLSQAICNLFERAEVGKQVQAKDGTLNKLANYRALDELRRRARHAASFSILGVEGDAADLIADRSSPAPVDQVLAHEKDERRSAALEGAMRDFTRQCEFNGQYLKKITFELRVVFGMQSPAVAKLLGVTATKVHDWTHDARQDVIYFLRANHDVRGSLFESRYDRKSKVYQQAVQEAQRHGNRKQVFDANWHLSQDMIQSFLDDPSTVDNVAQIKAHLAQCEGCTRAVQAQRNLDNSLRDELRRLRNERAALCPAPARWAEILTTAMASPEGLLEMAIHVMARQCPLCTQILVLAHDRTPEEIVEFLGA